MDPNHIIPALKAKLKKGKLLHCMRVDERNASPIWIIDFDGPLAHCKLFVDLENELQVLEGWEDVSHWNQVAIIGLTTEEEARIQADTRKKINESERHTSPIQALLGRALGGNVEISLGGEDDDTPTGRKN